MSITVTDKQFHLRTKDTSYVIHIFRDKYPVHLYWGDKLTGDDDLSYILDRMVADRAAGIHNNYDDVTKLFLSDVPMEFSTMAEGLYRTPTYHAKYADGSTLSDFAYTGYEIIKGKKKLSGLPGVYAENDSEAETLELTLTEKRSGVVAILSYTVFYDYNAITRSIRYENPSLDKVTLLCAKSCSVDFYAPDYELLHMHGDWLCEATVERTKLDHARVCVESNRGLSSAQQHPFCALLEKGANEEMGKVYGFSLVYSGSFQIEAEPTSTGLVRMNAGISSFDFGWELETGESFQTPEVVMVYSGCGIGKMSRTYHKLYRERLCRGKYRDEERPMLINHWDATGTVYTAERLVEIAEAGAKTGLELFVMDDGWFGDTGDEIRQLGDWFPDKRKFPNGLKPMVDGVVNSGMRFGIWFEPEVISVDSHLIKDHPDWVMTAPGYDPTPMYGQCILDFANPDVREYIINSISEILESCDITYLKWDYNRPIIETANQEHKHRAILGLYEVLETLINKFPNVLFEGCSSGGGRFDPGMLHYMPQTWTSDNQRANVRIGIQYGTSLVYPAITMGAHTGHISLGLKGKNNLLETSAHVAMCGNFGYEMDLAKLSEDEMAQVKDQIKLYKRIRKTVQFGEMYRFGNPFEENRTGVCYKDDDKMVLFTFQLRPQMNGEEWRIKISCADTDAQYEFEGKVYSGESLKKLGIRIPLQHYDYQTYCMEFNKVNDNKKLLIDTHAHSAGISPCSRRAPADLIAEYIADKTDGFVLANHCLHQFTNEIGYKAWCEKYVEEYKLTKYYGDKYGVRVFFGIEVTPDWEPNVHLLIYGITPDELLASPELYSLSLEELYAYCEENGFLLYQAHPYRNGMVPQNPKYLHGYEINCHPGHKAMFKEEVTAVAKENNLRLLCGSDYHGDAYKPKCGNYIPENIRTEKELAEYLRNNQPEMNVMEIIDIR